MKHVVPSSIRPAIVVLSRSLLLALAIALRPLPVAAQTAAAEPPVQMPEFVVESQRDLPPPESWRYASIPGFEILANSPDGETRRLIRNFQIFQRALSIVWPGTEQKTTVPVALVLCGAKDQFKLFRPAGKAGEARSDVALASLFFKDREHGAIVLDLQSSGVALVSHESLAMLADVELPDDAPTFANSASDYRIEHAKQLYREYVRFLLSNDRQRAPAWFEEGLAQLFMGMRIGKKEIVIGQLSDEPYQTPLTASSMALAGLNPRGAAFAPDQQMARDFRRAQQQLDGYTEKDFNHALAHRDLIPWQEFFTVEHGSATALNPLGSRWAKQAQAFVHLCLYGRDKRYQKAFLTFLSRVHREPITEALFQDCFKMSYAKMSDDLYGYIRTTAHKYYTLKLIAGTLEDPRPVELRDATETEVGRIKGTALGLADNKTAARLTLLAAYSRGSRDPELLAALGLAELAADDQTRAEKFLEAATTAQTGSPRAYLELARLRFDRATKVTTGGKLNASQVGGILQPLFVGREKSPLLPEIYRLIADTWSASQDAPRRENLGVLIEGVTRFPANTALIAKAAALYRQNGFTAEADELEKFGQVRGK